MEHMLARGMLVRIKNGRGTLVRVTGGAIWVTEEGDSRDRFVAAGGRFRVASRGLTLISAIRPSTITLSSPPERGFAQRLIKLWAGWFVPGSRPTTAAL